MLIESLNDDGYLADTLDDIAARLADMLGIDADEDEARDELMSRLQCALHWLQSMEPLGVGARDLAECLSLQLRAGPRCEAQAHRDRRSASTTWSCWRGATSSAWPPPPAPTRSCCARRRR